MKKAVLTLIVGCALVAQAAAQGAPPKAKVLSAPEDATKTTVLVGRASAANMIVAFEIEAAKGMWMRMGTPPRWLEHPAAAGENFHLEVKPTDPKSKTRIPYAEVRISAVNTANGKKVEGILHPMWGSSGLHYAMNSALAGDGTYKVQVTVDSPTFGRAPADKDLWREPVSASFHFKLKGNQLLEVSEPEL